MVNEIQKLQGETWALSSSLLPKGVKVGRCALKTNTLHDVRKEGRMCVVHHSSKRWGEMSSKRCKKKSKMQLIPKLACLILVFQCFEMAESQTEYLRYERRKGKLIEWGKGTGLGSWMPGFLSLLWEMKLIVTTGETNRRDTEAASSLHGIGQVT